MSMLAALQAGDVIALGDTRYEVLNVRHSHGDFQAELHPYGWVSVGILQRNGWKVRRTKAQREELARKLVAELHRGEG